MMARSNSWIAVTATGALVAVGVSFGLGTLVKSPWEEAMANSQREPLVTVPVEKRELAADVSDVRGRFSAGRELSITVPTTDVPAVVTKQTLSNGDAVTSGSLVAEVSGRPVIGLVTPFRLYRDLKPGDAGPDVVALQDALRALGVYAGSSDGEYGAGTAAAVSALYARLGYEVIIDQELTDAVKAAEETLAGARLAQKATGTTRAADTEGSPTGDDADAEQTDRAAQQQLADARFAALPWLRISEIVRLPDGGATVLASAELGAELDGLEAVGGAGDDAGSGSPGDLVRLRIGAPTVEARVGVASAGAFTEGVDVEVGALTDQRRPVTATVDAVSEFRQPDADTPGSLPGYDLTLVFQESPEFDDGATVTVESKEAAPSKASGLAVPVVALREDTGGTYVTVAGQGRVAAEVVATGDGYAVITAEKLSTDDDVVVSGSGSTSTEPTP